MSVAKRTTIRFEPALHRALRQKSAATECSVSELVNAAVRDALAEDADDLAASEKRRSERTRPFAAFVAGLRHRGRLER